MPVAGVRLVTNVLCARLVDEGRKLSPPEIASRLSYFQLLELSRVHPILWPPSLHYDQPTPRQVAQRNAFLREGVSSLWTFRADLQPMPGAVERNPYHDGATAGPPGEHVTTPAPMVPDNLARPAVAQEPNATEEEQERVVEADAGEDLFVVAPPGTGKTHALVERLAYLVSEGIARNPAEEILVLSFTRSAVAEVRKRLIQKRDSGGHPDVIYPKVVTFDSFATQCLLLDRDPNTLVGKSYSERIQLFNYLLKDDLPRASEMLGAVRFLLVDEVQDLNGARAQMVLHIARLIKQSGGAVCFLGDPAQAIYDFEGERDATLSSTDFLERAMSGSYATTPPSRVAFRQYRRFETPKMLEFVRRVGAAMGEDGLHPDGGRVEELLGELGEPCEFSTLPDTFGRSGTAAILTRTNLEAYQVWKLCQSRGLRPELWRGSSGNYWPGWIARLTLGFQQDSMSLEMAQKRWKTSIGSFVSMSFTEAFAFLKAQGVVDDDRIDLRQLNRVISRSAPILRKPEREGAVVISTIHRSKGLEFDDVLIYQPGSNFAGREDEVRVIYVAATRARKGLAVLRADQSIRWGAKYTRRARLSTHHFHLLAYPRYPSIGLLIDGADEVDGASVLHMASPAGQPDLAKTIWQLAGTGTPQNALIERSTATGRLTISVGGLHLCEPSPALVEDLETIASWQGKRFVEFRDFSVIDLAAHAFELESVEAQRAFGNACLGTIPVLSGMGTVIAGDQ